jgi:hypothetical protein
MPDHLTSARLAAHLRQRRADRWQVMVNRTPAYILCADCNVIDAAAGIISVESPAPVELPATLCLTIDTPNGIESISFNLLPESDQTDPDSSMWHRMLHFLVCLLRHGHHRANHQPTEKPHDLR